MTAAQRRKIRSPRLEVQLLRFHHPQPIPDPDILKLNKLGFNHLVFLPGPEGVTVELAQWLSDSRARAAQ